MSNADCMSGCHSHMTGGDDAMLGIRTIRHFNRHVHDNVSSKTEQIGVCTKLYLICHLWSKLACSTWHDKV